MVTAGHYLATASGYRILEQGGNATDAGVAAGITLNVVLPQWTNFGGVAPIIIHDAQKKETVEISGLGRWPKAANIDDYLAKFGGDLPAGIPRTVTPAAADAWMTASGITGLTLPGMMDEPGCTVGSFSSASPQRGPEPSQRMSFAIFCNATARQRSAPPIASTPSSDDCARK